MMDETQELLRMILSRLEEQSAAIIEDKVTGLQDQIREFHDETGVQLAKIEGRFGHLTEKWMEHDLEIYKLKRRQA